MKLTNYKHIIITLLLSTITCNASIAGVAKGSFSALCSGLELLLLTNAMLLTLRIYHPKIKAESLENYTSNAPEKITSFITELAEERNLKNIHVIVKDNGHRSYSTESHKRIIIVPTILAKELEELLDNNELNEENQKILNGHIAHLHHELTHIQMNDATYTHIYESVIGTVGSIAIISAISHMLTQHIPLLNNNYALYNLLKIVRGIAGLELAKYIIQSNLYKKYAELRADAGIPNKKELLESVAQCYEKEHKNILLVIDNIKSASYTDLMNRSEAHRKMLNDPQVFAMKILPKSWFNNHWVVDIVYHARFTHPSDIHRAHNFRKRIAELDKISSV